MVFVTKRTERSIPKNPIVDVVNTAVKKELKQIESYYK